MRENTDQKNSEYGRFSQSAHNFGYCQQLISNYRDSATQNSSLGYVCKISCFEKFPKIHKKNNFGGCIPGTL